MNNDKIKNKLDKIIALLKIIAKKNLEEIRSSVLSTEKKEKIFELCDGKHEMSEIAKKVSVTHEYVRLTIRDLEQIGIIMRKKRGKKFYPIRMI